MNIVIIGAGFCGVALTRALAHRLPASSRIILVGSKESFGRGVAYSTTRAEHCLNVRAVDLGIDPAQPAGFADWLELESPTREGFLPRTLYGDYLGNELHNAIAQAAVRGVEVHCIEGDAVAVERRLDGLCVRLAEGDRLNADRVVLAPGALPPLALQGLSPALISSPRYIASPFANNALSAIPAHANVLVIGSGLTFADVAISLHRQGHQGKIQAISRHGLMPLAHTARPVPPLPLSPSLQTAWDRGDLRGTLRELRVMARQADDWRRVIDALRPSIATFWRKLDHTQRSRFLRHARAYWEIHRHRVAAPLMSELEMLRQTGQLSLHASRLQHADLAGDRVRASVRDRTTGELRTVEADVLIRATGLETDIRRTNHALIVHLRETGMIQADAFGLGIQTTDAFQILDAQSQPIAGLYAMGPLLRSQWWEITAIPDLRRAVITLADTLTAT